MCVITSSSLNGLFETLHHTPHPDLGQRPYYAQPPHVHTVHTVHTVRTWGRQNRNMFDVFCLLERHDHLRSIGPIK